MARIKKIEYIADIPSTFAERINKMMKDGLIEPSNDEHYFRFTPTFQKLFDDCIKECTAEQHNLGTADLLDMAVMKAYVNTIKRGRVENADLDGTILLLIRKRYSRGEWK